MFAGPKPEVVADHVETLLKIGLGPHGKVCFALGYVCGMVRGQRSSRRLSHAFRSTLSSPSIRARRSVASRAASRRSRVSSRRAGCYMARHKADLRITYRFPRRRLGPLAHGQPRLCSSRRRHPAPFVQQGVVSSFALSASAPKRAYADQDLSPCWIGSRWPSKPSTPSTRSGTSPTPFARPSCAT